MESSVNVIFSTPYWEQLQNDIKELCCHWNDVSEWRGSAPRFLVIVIWILTYSLSMHQKPQGTFPIQLPVAISGLLAGKMLRDTW